MTETTPVHAIELARDGSFRGAAYARLRSQIAVVRMSGTWAIP